jgi:3-phenylpropionate/trans-cinnamate dioxygenase ferredoxin subunit
LSQPPGSDFYPVANAADLHDDDLVAVKTPHGEVCLLKYEGEVYAVSNCCTHSEFPISDGVLGRDGSLECVWHGARFDCRTGAVRRGPAEDPLPVYRVKVEGGTVFVGPRQER